MGDVNHVVQETVNANLIVKGFGGQIYEQERFKQNSFGKSTPWLENGGSTAAEQSSSTVDHVSFTQYRDVYCVAPTNSGRYDCG